MAATSVDSFHLLNVVIENPVPVLRRLRVRAPNTSYGLGLTRGQGSRMEAPAPDQARNVRCSGRLLEAQLRRDGVRRPPGGMLLCAGSHQPGPC